MKKLVSLILVMAMVLSLCACGKADDYEAAIALMEAENYEEAIAAFTELGDYEDSAQKLAECEDALSYAKAVSLFEAEQYEDALAIFTTLGDYRDSLEKKAECENALAYQAALDMIASGDYEKAYTALVELGNYKDVPELLTHFKEVDITPENWRDYFVVAEEPEYIKNDFNEIIDIVLSYYLCLNDKILSKIYSPAECTVIFELCFDETPKDIQLGSEEDNYVISNSEYFKAHKRQESTTLTYAYSSSPKCFIVRNNRIAEAAAVGQTEPAPSAYIVPENFEATRTQGSIFIYE